MTATGCPVDEFLAETSIEFYMLLYGKSAGTDVLETGGPGGASLTLPTSGSARPFWRNRLAVSYGNGLLAVTGVCGSFFSRKSSQARRPFADPNRFRNAW